MARYAAAAADIFRRHASGAIFAAAFSLRH